MSGGATRYRTVRIKVGTKPYIYMCIYMYSHTAPHSGDQGGHQATHTPPNCLIAQLPNCQLANLSNCLITKMKVGSKPLILRAAFEKDSQQLGLLLPGQQPALAAAVLDAIANAAAGGAAARVALVLSGSSVDVTSLRDDARLGAVLWAGYAGEAGRGAVRMGGAQMRLVLALLQLLPRRIDVGGAPPCGPPAEASRTAEGGESAGGGGGGRLRLQQHRRLAEGGRALRRAPPPGGAEAGRAAVAARRAARRRRARRGGGAAAAALHSAASPRRPRPRRPAAREARVERLQVMWRRVK